jgi:hypothetical protein
MAQAGVEPNSSRSQPALQNGNLTFIFRKCRKFPCKLLNYQLSDDKHLCYVNTNCDTAQRHPHLMSVHGSLQRQLAHQKVFLFIAIFDFFLAQHTLAGQGLLYFDALRSHSDTHHTRYDSSGKVISQTPRPLLDNTQRSQEIDIHDPSGIRPRNPCMPAAPGPRLRPRATGIGATLDTLPQIALEKQWP